MHIKHGCNLSPFRMLYITLTQTTILHCNCLVGEKKHHCNNVVYKCMRVFTYLMERRVLVSCVSFNEYEHYFFNNDFPRRFICLAYTVLASRIKYISF